MVSDRAYKDWVDAARGQKLADVLARRGHKLRPAGAELVGPCPAPGCGGRDRFAVHLAKNLWNCRVCCKGGDAIALIEHIEGAPFLLAVEILTGEPPPGSRDGETGSERTAREARLAEVAAEAQAAEVSRMRDRAKFREWERERLWTLWHAATPIAGTPVQAYLALRGLVAPPGAHLRYAADHCLWSEPPPKGEVIHRGPAMLAAIQGPDGRFAGLHATWIDLADPDGKARVPDPKTGEFVAAKKTRGSIKGGTIFLARCRECEAKILVIGEGIETVLSVHNSLVAAQSDLLAKAEFRSGVSLGNLSGRAEGQVAHPTLTTTDKLGRLRREMVRNAVPHLGDRTPVIAIGASITDVILLGDGDSEPFRTRLALQRAAARLVATYPRLTVGLAMAPESQDFNDVWREIVAEQAVMAGAVEHERVMV